MATPPEHKCDPRAAGRRPSGPASRTTGSPVIQTLGRLGTSLSEGIKSIASWAGTSRANLAIALGGLAAIVLVLCGLGGAFGPSVQGTTTSSAEGTSSASGAIAVNDESSSAVTTTADDEGSDESTGAELALTTSEHGSHGIVVTSTADFIESDEFSALDSAVTEFESHGYQLGFVLVDLDTGQEVSLNEDGEFYPASSIKAPFVMSLYQEHFEVDGGESAYASEVKDVIENSDNTGYSNLQQTFGSTYLTEWLDDAGISCEGTTVETDFYPIISPRQLCDMWIYGYSYLTSDGKYSSTCANLLANTTVSGLRSVLGKKYTVWSKAGWYPDQDNCSATVEAGVVFSDTGTYVVAIMSDAPEDFESLEKLEDALNVTHAAMTGGDTSSLFTDATPIANQDE